mmetsp:Transcript_6256/g.19339  ORF Transcript_6256/g.19339 Transcript_6256/m.19339 type:complete len:88 (+) Transcript_6256:448-711(+)
MLCPMYVVSALLHPLLKTSSLTAAGGLASAHHGYMHWTTGMIGRQDVTLRLAAYTCILTGTAQHLNATQITPQPHDSRGPVANPPPA